MPAKRNSLTGVAGEYYVCAVLSQMGYIAVLAPKNNPLFDIVATNQEGSRSVTIQVKTRAADNKELWKLGKNTEQKHNNPELFVVLVALNEDGVPEFYVFQHDVLSDLVASEYREYMTRPTKTGKPKKDTDFRWCLADSPVTHGVIKNDWHLIIQKLTPATGEDC
jgi:hypothetical protein